MEGSTVRERALQQKLLRSWAARIGVWALLLLTLMLLRPFFALIFLTFVFSYLQATVIRRLERCISRRSTRVVVVGIALLGLIVGLGTFIVPATLDQARLVADNLPTYIKHTDQRFIELAARYPLLGQLASPTEREASSVGEWVASPTVMLLQQIIDTDKDHEGANSVRQLVEAIRSIGSALVGAGSAFLLSLLFSFLIMLDFPALAEGTTKLRETKVRFIYEEVAGTIYDFSTVLGRALEAQLVIALLNTALTACGIYLLGMGSKVALLSLVVFLCSFIPVAGVFISSVPICLLALQQAGFSLLFLAILLITVVHLVEAYVLNPRIYGHHLRMNPVVVLIILTIAGKLFHGWGLVLGVPLCTYIFGHAIRDPQTADAGQTDR